MSTIRDFKYCEVVPTPEGFDIEKFREGDEAQLMLYKNNKTPKQRTKLTYAQISDPDKPVNYARYVPDGCIFIDFDEPGLAKEMAEIVLHSGLKCLILKTIKGYHFLFRKPEFYKKEMTGATNWFGYKFDTKGERAVQLIRVCGMERPEVFSTDPYTSVTPLGEVDIDELDVLPYWLWGKAKDTDLHKRGEPGESHYTLTDNPFTQLMCMREGGRHNHIVERCSMFGLSNGFEMEEFKDLIQAIHDQYLVKLGTPMPETDLFGDLDTRWADYKATLESNGWVYHEDKRKWVKAKAVATKKLDERRACDYLFGIYDFYGINSNDANGIPESVVYRKPDGSYDYSRNVTVYRGALREYSDQNFKQEFYKEVEAQLKQKCTELGKTVTRTDKYIIVNNKALSCISKDTYDFDWLGDKPPTDVVLPWTWYPEEWVTEHEKDLGANITWFIKQLARDASGVTQPDVEQWLWVIAGASMVPANKLEKIVILSGGGQNGKSLYTSLIRFCLGEPMYNESKIFDSSPHDGFWGEDLDKGILCVNDDLNRVYNKDSFSYIKGALTGSDSIVINEKFKPKKPLAILPQIIACTNFEFELYDKSDGMKRRVKILPTEYRVPDSMKDDDLQYKLVLNTTSKEEILEYKLSEDSFNVQGKKIIHMYTREKGVLDSLANGSLAWFANKARYTYLKWMTKELVIVEGSSMAAKMSGVFTGGYDTELIEFLEWYITERKEDVWAKELFLEYQDWHTEKATGEAAMTERVFSRNIVKAVTTLEGKGYKLTFKKAKNSRGIVLNKLFIGEGV